jgi:hypothetical protein
MAYTQQHPSYTSAAASATASTIAAARYGAYTPSYQRPYIPGAQHTPYLPQQPGYSQMYSLLQQPQIPLNQAPAKQQDNASPDEPTSSAVLRRFVLNQLMDAGFTGSETQSLLLLEKEVISSESISFLCL